MRDTVDYIMRKRWIGSIFLAALAIVIIAVKTRKEEDVRQRPPFLQVQDSLWVDSLMNTLTPDERIGQLFMVAAYSDKKNENKKEIHNLIRNYNIGGLIFMKGEPARQAELTNSYQSAAKVPLMIAMDAEWGLSMRLDSTMKFPYQMALGAISEENDSLVYAMGREIARQAKRMGVHVSFSPVVDVNNNPNNPVINYRSFGEDKENVAQKGILYMRGLQDERIIASAKHFPGHGDTDSDSHQTLPVILHNKERLESVELYPFKKLIQAGVASIMVAHLYIPAYDSSAFTAASISPKVVNNLLKTKLGFEGLVFTDALNMKGVSNYFPVGKLDVKALLAGNDVLLFPEDVSKAIYEIKKSIERGEITQAEIDKRVRKILLAKAWVGLNDFQPVSAKNLYRDLNTKDAELLRRKLIEASFTLAKNENDIIPFKDLEEYTIASVAIGNDLKKENIFQNTLKNYAGIATFQLSKNMSDREAGAILDSIKKYDVAIISLHDLSQFPFRNYGLTEDMINFIGKAQKQTQVALTLFGNPYALAKLPATDAVFIAYEEDDVVQSLAAQALFGGIEVSGKLPVTVTNELEYGDGEHIPQIRLKYTIPEEVGIRPQDLQDIEKLIDETIREMAAPGGQILAVKDGKVFYQRAFGHHTYDKKQPVQMEDIYDLASITKIAATMLAVMKLYDLGVLHLDSTLAHYLPELKKTNKRDIILRDVLMHQAGLKDWIPFYLYTLNERGYCDTNYCYVPNTNFTIPVAENLYIRDAYADTMWAKIFESDVKPAGEKYVYSDLGFYMLKRIVEKETKMPFDEFLSEHFYEPLGTTAMTFNPLQKFPASRIVPSEKDDVFRRQVVRGYVHDPGAAMLGGISGHAGLFSNAHDLAIIMQMLLNGGEYGGRRYFEESTVERFTQTRSPISRRGMGFDKAPAVVDDPQKSPTAISASPRTFGHTGFTGTGAWADPESGLIFIFLSNRTFPTAKHWNLIKLNIRPRMQDVFYQAVARRQAKDTARVN